jgi:hypothetical protein
MIIKGNRKFKCPHCGEKFDEPIGDFVVPGYIGHSSISKDYSDCGNCDGIFSVEKISETEYKLTPVQGTYKDTRP